jgi:hypothetical protein
MRRWVRSAFSQRAASGIFGHFRAFSDISGHRGVTVYSVVKERASRHPERLQKRDHESATRSDDRADCPQI